jgi:hypothetical protein
MKPYKLFILYTLILSNPFHIIFGSNFFLHKVNFEFQNVAMQILKFFVHIYNSRKMSSKF